jgi:transposase
LPLYRQTEMFKCMGIELNCINLANWMIKMGELVEPLLKHYIAHLQPQNVLHMVETTLQVLDELGKSAQSKSYMWLMACFDRYPVVAYPA